MKVESQKRPFEAFDGEHYMLLTTFGRDGRAVPTPVHAYLIDERLFFITDVRSGKAKRLRRNPHVTIAPCTVRGAPKGETVHARVCALSVEEAHEVNEKLAAASPVNFRLGKWLYNVRGRQTAVFELLRKAFARPDGPQDDTS